MWTSTATSMAPCLPRPAVRINTLWLDRHMDTADDASGENVQPVVWENYNGGDVTLPATGMVMKPSVFPFLTSMKARLSSPQTVPPCWVPTIRPVLPKF